MSVFASYVTLSEAWRWQGGAGLLNQTSPNRGVVGPDGTVIVAGVVPRESGGASSEDALPEGPAARLAIFKLHGETGELLWTFKDDTHGGIYDQVLSIDVDMAGDIIVGKDRLAQSDARGPRLRGQHAVFKLNGETGEEIWRRRVKPRERQVAATATSEEELPSFADIIALALTVDSSGDAFVVGYTQAEELEDQGADNGTDYFVRKFNGSTGQELWVVGGGGDDSFDELLACDVDSGDHVIAAGLTTGAISGDAMGGRDLLVVKFDGDGEVVWSWQNGTTHDEILLGVTVDREDNIYVTGGEGIATFDAPIANTSIVRKLDGATGTEIWSYSGDSTGGSVFRAISFEETSGVVVAAGVAEGVWDEDNSSSSGGYDFTAVALDATTGEERGRWQAGTPLGDSVGFVGFDSAGALVFGGYSEGAWCAADSIEDGYSAAVIRFTPPGYVYPGGSGATRSGGWDKSQEWKIVASVAGVAAVMVFVAVVLKKKSISNNLKSTVEDFTSVYEYKQGSIDLEAQPTKLKVDALQWPVRRMYSERMSTWSSRGLSTTAKTGPVTLFDVPAPTTAAPVAETKRRPTLQRYFPPSHSSSSSVDGDAKSASPKYRSRRTLMFPRFVVGAAPPSPIEIAPKRGGGNAQAMPPSIAEGASNGPSASDAPTAYASPVLAQPIGASTYTRPKGIFDTLSQSVPSSEDNAAAPASSRPCSSVLGNTSIAFGSMASEAVLTESESTSSASSADYYACSPSILNSEDLSDSALDSESYSAMVEDRLAKLVPPNSIALASVEAGDRGITAAPPGRLVCLLDSDAGSVVPSSGDKGRWSPVPPFGHLDSASASVFRHGNSTKKVTKPAAAALESLDSASASVYHHQSNTTHKVAKPAAPASDNLDSTSSSVFHHGKPTKEVGGPADTPLGRWDSALRGNFDVGETAKKSFRSDASMRSARWDSASDRFFLARVRPAMGVKAVNAAKAKASEPSPKRKIRPRPPRFGPCPQQVDREWSASGSVFGGFRSWTRRGAAVPPPVDHFDSASGSVFRERTKRTKAERTAKLRDERMKRGGSAKSEKKIWRGIVHVDSAAGSVYQGGSGDLKNP